MRNRKDQCDRKRGTEHRGGDKVGEGEVAGQVTQGPTGYREISDELRNHVL